jgi:hypothetical protein
MIKNTLQICGFVLICLIMTGCATTNKEHMQGTPVTGQMEAYTKMCMRDPGSVLCPQEEFFITNSSTLNEQWCEICRLDSSYSWCRHFPECVANPLPQPEPEPTGETMQGTAVKIRAKAYQDLCNRTPESVLCKQ